MSKRLAILQPCYIPWKGYFDIMASVDEFVILDDVQFVKQSWYNRNRLKTPNGSKWLSIPVKTSGRLHQTIKETTPSAPWVSPHIDFIKTNYHRAPFFEKYFEELSSVYAESARKPELSQITTLFMAYICRCLGISVNTIFSSDFSSDGVASDRVLDICLKRGASLYLSGPAAKAYLDVAKFEAASVKVQWMDYSGYPEYAQLYPPFDHAVSVLDLLFHTGDDAPRYMKFVRGAA